jgi:hypothetical protein
MKAIYLQECHDMKSLHWIIKVHLLEGDLL